MFTHKMAVNLSNRINKNFEGDQPKYFGHLSDYLKASSRKGLRGSVLKLMAVDVQQDECRKELNRSFSVSEADYLEMYRFNIKNENSLIHMLEATFICDYLNGSEVSTRYEELLKVVSEFKEIGTNLFVHENNRAVKFVLGVSGRCYEYVKGANYDQTVFSDNEIKMTYKDGHEDVIFDGTTFSTNCRDGFGNLQKGYKRYSAGEGIYFRAHVLITALVYGVEVIKYTLGRNSLLTIDHIDGNESNNTIINLRLVTRRDNTILSGVTDYKVLDFLQLPFASIKKVKTLTGVNVGSVVLMQEDRWEGLPC